VTDAELARRVRILPEIRRLILPPDQGGINYPNSELQTDINNGVSSAVQQVSADFEWDFALRDSTVSSVATQSEYKLPGANNDALSLYSVKYDSTPLEWKTREQMDIILEDGALSVISYYILQEPVNQHPKIEIFGTPSEGGDTITYVYWRNDVDIQEFPPGADQALVYALASQFINAYYPLYKAALRDAIAGYQRYGAGRGKIQHDSMVRDGNIRRAELHGW